MSKKPRIRPLAMCVPRIGQRIFVAENQNPQDGSIFYRAIGGKIDFGERAIEAVQREFLEEINAPLQHLHYETTLENIFTYLGQPGHELCLMFSGAFVEEERNAPTYTVRGEDDDKLLFIGRWLSLDTLQMSKTPLYPAGLLECVRSFQRSY